MILVTGSTGNVGQHVVAELAKQGCDVKAMSRNSRTDLFSGTNKVDTVTADFTDSASLDRAMKGVRKVVLISPADENMVQHQLNVIDAARRAGVERIVKLSGLGAGPDAPIRLPKLHYEIERSIVAGGFTYGFVRPNLFMQVLLGHKQTIEQEAKIYAPAGKGKISFIDTRDVASVIVHSILSSANEIHEITGPHALSFADVAEQIAIARDANVNYVDVSPINARHAMLDSGMQSWLVEAFLELFDIYRDGHGEGILSDAVTRCKDRAARNIFSFIGENFSG